MTVIKIVFRLSIFRHGSECGNKTFREEFYSNKDLLADSITALRSELQKAVRKYNDYRPHASLQGLTPSLYIQNGGYFVSSHVNLYKPNEDYLI